MSPEADLDRLLASMSPRQRPGQYVFVVLDDGPADLEVLASVVEPEGRSVVTTQHDADRLDLEYDYVAGWITLQVHSALAAIGLTSAVSGALADAGISCNVIAGFHHDHLLVPVARVGDALDVLAAMSAVTPVHPPTIRPARAADARAMAVLAHDAYGRYVERMGRKPGPMSTDYLTVAQGTDAWIAERGGRIAGFVVLHPEADHLLLANVAVASTEQGHGVGTALLQFAEQQAHARELPRIRLYTHVTMTENRAWYERHGYVETHRATVDGFDRVHLVKDLPR